jgi:hypothetical protein
VLSGEGREGEERCASPALVLPPPPTGRDYPVSRGVRPAASRSASIVERKREVACRREESWEAAKGGGGGWAMRMVERVRGRCSCCSVVQRTCRCCWCRAQWSNACSMVSMVDIGAGAGSGAGWQEGSAQRSSMEGRSDVVAKRRRTAPVHARPMRKRARRMRCRWEVLLHRERKGGSPGPGLHFVSGAEVGCCGWCG